MDELNIAIYHLKSNRYTLDQDKKGTCCSTKAGVIFPH